MQNLPEVTEETPERVIRVRVSMIQAFAQMLDRAFDALLYHQINYRDLPEWNDTSLLDEAQSVSLVRGHSIYIEWIKRVESGIRAAINRKGMRKV